VKARRARGWAAAGALVMLAFGGGLVHAGEMSAQWALRIIKAYNQLNYQGVFVYQKNDTLEAMRVIHSADQGGQTRLVALNGEVNEIHRRGDQMTRYLPGRGIFIEGLRWSNPFFSAVPADISRLAAHYSLEVDGVDRIAGRPCQRVEIRPRDALRYGYRLCVDRETNLILHAQRIAEKGRVRQEVMFTQLTIQDRLDPALLAPGMDVAKLKRYVVKTEIDGVKGMAARTWDVTDPPAGYRLVFGADHSLSGGGSQEHLVYSDGLSAISVFVDNTPLAGKPILGQTSRGSMNAYGVVRDGYQVLVVGEVPYTALRMMAESLQRRP
jgi:sigma-E factor negative regulatory protein RseB